MQDYEYGPSPSKPEYNGGYNRKRLYLTDTSSVELACSALGVLGGSAITAYELNDRYIKFPEINDRLEHLIRQFDSIALSQLPLTHNKVAKLQERVLNLNELDLHDNSTSAVSYIAEEMDELNNFYTPQVAYEETMMRSMLIKTTQRLEGIKAYETERYAGYSGRAFEISGLLLLAISSYFLAKSAKRKYFEAMEKWKSKRQIRREINKMLSEL